MKTTALHGGSMYCNDIKNKNIIVDSMRRKKILMSVLFLCVVFTFTTSCVQIGLFDDICEESNGWLLPRNKRGKDYNPGMENLANKLFADRWAQNHDFASNESECLACALYNYSIAKGLNKTRYQMRQYVGNTRYGEDWQYQYYLAVTQHGGVLLENEEVNAVISLVVGALNQTSLKENLKPQYFVNVKNYENDVVIEVDSTHYGVLQCVWQDRDNYNWYIHIKDQTGDGQLYSFPEITGVWY